MYLEKLELQGFKSFPSKTTLEFRQGITAIVGPNGSGKSNVADAIRWVLGEQSLKLIRGKRAEDVIFAGSDRKTKLGAAEVSLYLNNEDGRAPIDFSELVITRRVYRDGSGEYFVNKRPVRLQDIMMLLAKSNFGQRTYSVIGQGMVDSILVTSPPERKHFFDEAAGVRQYQLKREQTVTKLDHTRENLRQAEALIQEIEPRLRSLTRQVRRLERRSEVEQELTRLQTAYYRGILQELRRQMTEALDRQRQLESESELENKAVTTLNAELAKLEQEHSRSEAFASLQRQFERAQADKSVLLAEDAVLKGRRETAFKEYGQGDVVWLEKQVASLNHQLKDLKAESANLENEQKSAAAKLSSLKLQLKERRLRQAALEEQLKRTVELTARDGVTTPAVQSEFRELFVLEQSFLEQLLAVTSLPELEGLKKRVPELRDRTARFAKNLERAGVGDGPASVIELQNKLYGELRNREDLLHTIGDIELAVRVHIEKQSLLKSTSDRLREEDERLERELTRARAATKKDMDATLRDQSEALAKKIAAVDEQLATITSAIQNFNASESAKRDELFRIQRELRTAQDRLNQTTTKLNEVRIEVARLETRLQDVEREIRDEVNANALSDIFTSQESSSPPPELADEIARLKHQLSLIGGIDVAVEKEYHVTHERYTFLKTQYDDLIKASEQLEQGIAELDKTIKERFDEAFKKISDEFTKFFRILFRGGNAKLLLVKEIVPEEIVDEDEEGGENKKTVEVAGPAGEKVITGIEIQATPPGKRLKGIAMLSGGERALTSIALICAIISNNPMPFVVLDEVDAALDEANSQRFAAILDQLAHKTQFVMITHNRATMEKANILYGVTMGDDGASKLLSVKLEEAEHVIKKFGNR
ncbi:MAG: chromosome segregation protein SMC [Candidatus Kerfeldbacteria bacterium]|nr:chromosome segregation protein SMC [Candidatus Kerfeldbacteria bacterium]